jgi:hypothetical protein
MAGKKYPNSGIMSRNKNQKTDKHPEFTGSAEVNGVEYWIAGWVNENDRGKYFKLSFEPKDDQASAGERSQVLPHDDDEVPF